MLNTMPFYPLPGRKARAMELVLIRYGELFLKSEPVRRHFIGILLRNLKRALDARGLEHRFEVHRGRILVAGDDPGAIASIASRVFGVVDVSVSLRTDPDPEHLCESALSRARESLKPGMTFAVRAKRQGVQGTTSQELAAGIGAAVMDAVPGIKVDLSSPDYELFVEMRDFGGFVYDSRVAGPGGLPWGTQGRLLSLLSSGIDSPVASWLMMKRGCEVTHLHFDAGPFSGPDVKETVFRHHCTLSTWISGFPLELLVLDAEYFYEALTSRVKPRWRCVLCKRFMVGAGSMIGKEAGMQALLTGDNLGQVASQTLVNLATITDAATVAVLRPLIAFDKEGIVDLARKIQTFDQVQGDLGCRAVPKMPATSAGIEDILEAEEILGMQELIDDARHHVRRYTAQDGELVES